MPQTENCSPLFPNARTVRVNRTMPSLSKSPAPPPPVRMGVRSNRGIGGHKPPCGARAAGVPRRLYLFLSWCLSVEANPLLFASLQASDSL